MDLVSFDTPGEFKMFEEIMARGEATSSDLYQLLLKPTCANKHTHQLGGVIREWFLKLPTMVVVGRFNECVMVGRQFESVKSGRDGCPRLPPLPLTGPSLGMRRDKPLCECASRHPPDLYRTWLLPRNHPHMYRFQMFCV